MLQDLVCHSQMSMASDAGVPSIGPLCLRANLLLLSKSSVCQFVAFSPRYALAFESIDHLMYNNGVTAAGKTSRLSTTIFSYRARNIHRLRGPSPRRHAQTLSHQLSHVPLERRLHRPRFASQAQIKCYVESRTAPGDANQTVGGLAFDTDQWCTAR